MLVGRQDGLMWYGEKTDGTVDGHCLQRDAKRRWRVETLLESRLSAIGRNAMQLCRNVHIGHGGNQKQGKIRLVGTEGNAHETQLRAHTALAGRGKDGAEAHSPNATLT